MSLAKPQSGVSLIEMMIGVAVIGVLFAMGTPVYRTWIQNQQVRNQAESISAGLQLARAEGIKRNTTVEFVLTNSDVGSGSANSIAPSASGKNWMIRQYRNVSDDYVFIESAVANQGAKNTTVATTPSASTVTFDGFGRAATNADGSTRLQRIDVDSSQLGADASRELRVQVSLGGGVRLCDPNALPTDPRRCM